MMSRKRDLRLWALLCGFVLCAVVWAAEDDNGLQEKKAEVMRLVASGSEDEVVDAVGEMIDEYRGEPALQKQLMKIVARCKFRRKYGLAAAIDELIAEKYANSPIGAIAGFGAEKARVLELIKARKYAEAEAATKSLIEDAGEYSGLAGALFEITDRYEEQRELERARVVYERIVSDYPESKSGLSAQKRVVMQKVEAKDWAAARDSTDTLIAVFADDERLLEALYEVKKAYEEAHRHEEATLLYDKMALHYEQGDGNLDVLADAYEGMAEAMYRLAGRYAASGEEVRAEALWRELAENLPGDDYAFRASAHLIMQDIRSGDEAAVEAGLDELVADYNEHPGAAEWVFRIGEVCFREARIAERDGLKDEALGDYGQAANVWAQVDRLKYTDGEYAAHACHFSGACYANLGDMENALECYQKAASLWPGYEYAARAQLRVAFIYGDLKRQGILPEGEATHMITQVCERVINNWPDSRQASVAQLLNKHSGVTNP